MSNESDGEIIVLKKELKSLQEQKRNQDFELEEISNREGELEDEIQTMRQREMSFKKREGDLRQQIEQLMIDQEENGNEKVNAC